MLIAFNRYDVNLSVKVNRSTVLPFSQHANLQNLSDMPKVLKYLFKKILRA